MRARMLVRAVATIAIAALALLAAGCGGGDDGDPGQILEETFSNDQSIDSGVLDISLDAGASGEQGGTVTASLGGPFQSRESDQLPLVDFDLSLQVDDGGAGTDFEGGALITADGAYISSAGQAYEVDEQTFTTFTESYAQSARARDEQTEEGSAIFDRLGVDPATWLTDVTNEGTEEVGGVETTHISGDADVAQIIEDAQRLDDLTGSAAGAGSGELADSVRSASVDVFTGVDDRLLRRLVLDLELEDPGQSDATINFALSIEISDLNAEQSFEAPADARPIDELIPGGLGAIGAGGLGALGGAPGAGSGGAGGGGSGGGGGGGSGGGGLGGLDALETNPEYVECLQNASSPEAVDECNDLL